MWGFEKERSVKKGILLKDDDDEENKFNDRIIDLLCMAIVCERERERECNNS
jgi:hypothetical protein